MTELCGDGDQRMAAYSLAVRIKDEVKKELGFTVNVGISENKLLAKMASDFQKPDRVHTLFMEEVPAKMWPLPIRDLYGCGGATAGKLTSMGLSTIGDAAASDIEILKSALGDRHGTYIHEAANGRGSSEVHTGWEEAKSYSNETTTPHDIVASNYDAETPAILRELSGRVAERMQRDGVFASTVGVSAKTDTFARRSRQETLASSTNDPDVIYNAAAKLLRELLMGSGGLISRGYGIRLIGVGASNLDHGEYRQMDIFEALREREKAVMTAASDEEREKRAASLRMMQKEIEERFGPEVLKKGMARRGQAKEGGNERP